MDVVESRAPQADALVIFGVTGDLAHKMIFPALYAMVKRGTLTVPITGVALPKWSHAQLHDRIVDSIKRTGGIDDQHYGSGVSFRDLDGIALEFFAPPGT